MQYLEDGLNALPEFNCNSDSYLMERSVCKARLMPQYYVDITQVAADAGLQCHRRITILLPSEICRGDLRRYGQVRHYQGRLSQRRSADHQ